MWRLVVAMLTLGLGACAGTSYGAATDGTFPLRPDGSDYPNWEHMCTVFTSQNASRVLNEAGEKGWELVGVGKQSTDDMMCFKRAKPIR